MRESVGLWLWVTHAHVLVLTGKEGGSLLVLLRRRLRCLRLGWLDWSSHPSPISISTVDYLAVSWPEERKKKEKEIHGMCSFFMLPAFCHWVWGMHVWTRGLLDHSMDRSIQQHMRVLMPRRVGAGLNKPTGPVKPAQSFSGLSDWFDRKPVKFQNRMFNRFRPVYRPV